MSDPLEILKAKYKDDKTLQNYLRWYAEAATELMLIDKILVMANGGMGEQLVHGPIGPAALVAFTIITLEIEVMKLKNPAMTDDEQEAETTKKMQAYLNIQPEDLNAG